METKITLDKQYAVKTFFGTELRANYFLTTNFDSQRKNTYKIICKIGCIEIAEPYLYTISAELIGDSNSETLTNEAAIYLFEDSLNR